jgi:hypothetical protein
MYHLIDYIWTVENFARYLDPHDQEVYPLLTSPIFSYKNTRWVLNLYPEGLGDIASQNYVSLFIKYVSEDPETINAKVELSILNNKNERVYCRDTGDHQYQTFIDFGYKQFLKIQEIKEQKMDLLFARNNLKIFTRVEFEHANLPLSPTWSNYDLLLLKENLKDLYETKHLYDVVIRLVSQPKAHFAQDWPTITTSVPPPTADNNRYHPYKSTEPARRRLKTVVNNKSCVNQTSIDEQPNKPYDIKAHKFILASRSGKFRELLNSGLKKFNSDLDNTKLSNKKPILIVDTNNNSLKSPLTENEITSDRLTAGCTSSSFPSSSSSSSSLSSCSPSSSAAASTSTQADHSDNDNAHDSNSTHTDLVIIETQHKPIVIESLIKYIYTGYLERLDDTHAKDVYDVSKEYKVHGLTNLARDQITRDLNINNCCDYLIFCVVNNDYELNNKIQTFIRDNFDMILKTNAYKAAKRKYRELFENTFNDITKKPTSSSSLSSTSANTKMQI